MIPHPQQRIKHRFYTAIAEWFEGSGVDFWKECNAAEDLAVIVTLIHDELIQESNHSDAQSK